MPKIDVLLIIHHQYDHLDYPHPSPVDQGVADSRGWANVHMNPEHTAQAIEGLGTRVLMQVHLGRFSISPHDLG